MKFITRLGYLFIILHLSMPSIILPLDQAASISARIPNVLIVHLVKGFGGGCKITKILLKEFREKGWNVRAFVFHGSRLCKEMEEEGLPHIEYLEDTGLFDALCKVCQEYKIDVIHCNKAREYAVVKRVAKKLKIASLAHYHSDEFPVAKQFNGFDAFIAASPRVEKFMRLKKNYHAHKIKHVEFISPVYEEQRFLNFVPSQTKVDFFKQTYGIELQQAPIICMNANLVACKNHKLLLDATSELVNKRNIPVEVILAGEGILKQKLIEYAKKLGIQHSVHFLGFTSKIPEILYYSDIKVLPSLRESFGVALLEAALMKKPIVLSHSAALAGILICHGQTGLLCKPNEARDLADQLELLIKNREYAAQLGENVYLHVQSNFLSSRSFEKIRTIYMRVYQEKIDKKMRVSKLNK